MNYSVYLRPLAVEDARVSYQWRNNPLIWRFTGSKPDRYVTPEMETEWIVNVLKRTDEKRFAIIVKQNEKYIGNIFLTGIHGGVAEHHIFIGDVEYWGGGRAGEASILILDYGFNTLGLHTVFIMTKKRNVSAVATAERIGWKQVEEFEDGYVKHIYTRHMLSENMKSGFLQQRFAEAAIRHARPNN